MEFNYFIFKVIILCFKLFSHSTDVKQAEVDVLKNGLYQYSYAYKKIIIKKSHPAYPSEKYAIYVSSISRNKRRYRFKVRSIDYGLYKLTIKGNRPVTMNMNNLLKKIKWKKLKPKKQSIWYERKKIYIYPGSSNFYVSVPNYQLTFVINKKYFKIRYPGITKFSHIRRNRGKIAKIKGFFRKFRPWKRGKGRRAMFWDYEIVLRDQTRIPCIAATSSLNLKKYLNKKVILIGKVFYGIIIGSRRGQNMTGYRIDVHAIKKR